MAMLLFACQENVEPLNGTNAIITDFNAMRCMCCGGYMITLSDNPTPYEETYFQWFATQEYDDLDIDANLPLYVNIEYTIDPDRCSFAEGWINISKLTVIEK